MKQFVLTLIVAAFVLSITTAVPSAQGHKAPAEEATVTLLTENPSLGTTVYFAMTVPKTLAKYNILIQLTCVLTLDPPQPNPRVGWVIYAEAKAKDAGFLLGGTDSTWLTQFPSSSVHCMVEPFYTVRQAGQQQVRYIAFTEFDATGVGP